MAGKNDVVLYDYNIYRISFEKHDEFIEHLCERSFEEIPLKQSLLDLSPNVSYTLLYCDKENKNGSHWVRLLSSCSEWELEQEAKIYGAALVCKGEDFCYVVSYGNAHFYISKFCDYNFGVSVAERIIDLDSIKSQQNISHGNRLNKTHLDYFRNTPISYGSGEIPTYIKGKSIDSEFWGEIINCGTSAQFKWVESPLQIGNKLIALDNAIKTDSNIKLPRLTPLDDERDSEKIEHLFLQLAQSIRDYDPNKTADYLNVPSFYLLGTRIIQTDFSKYKITCDYKRIEIHGELNIVALKDFLENKEIDVITHIRKINIAVEYSTGQWTPLKPIIEYMEFITDDNFCLRNGKWCSFNTSYVERVLADVSRVKFSNHFNGTFLFSKTDLLEFANKTGIYVERKQQPYESYFNKKLEGLLSATCQHPDTALFEEGHSFRYEPCDLFTDDTLFFVKIGEPSDFAIAIDQATLTLQTIKSSNRTIILRDNIKVTPETFVLILVFDKRKSLVTQWSDINSMNFLIHLSDLRNDLSLAGINLQVNFCYEFIDKVVTDEQII